MLIILDLLISHFLLSDIRVPPHRCYRCCHIVSLWYWSWKILFAHTNSTQPDLRVASRNSVIPIMQDWCMGFSNCQIHTMHLLVEARAVWHSTFMKHGSQKCLPCHWYAERAHVRMTTRNGWLVVLSFNWRWSRFVDTSLNYKICHISDGARWLLHLATL